MEISSAGIRIHDWSALTHLVNLGYSSCHAQSPTFRSLNINQPTVNLTAASISFALAALLSVASALGAETPADTSSEAGQEQTEAEQEQTEAEQEETEAERQERDAEQEEVEQLEADADGSIVDVEVSVEEAAGKLGLSLSGDLRTSYAYEDRDRRDLSTTDADLFGTRWRVEAGWVITDYMRAVGRVAGICTTDD